MAKSLGGIERIRQAMPERYEVADLKIVEEQRGKGTPMTVVAGRPAIPIQRPHVRPVEQGSEARPQAELALEAPRGWMAEVLACKRLIVLSLAFVAIGLAFDYACGMYVHTKPGVKAPDLILDLFDPINASFLFIYGYVSLIVGMFAYPALFRLRMIHLETPAGAITVSYPFFFRSLYFENDMFFSGHTAMPFLGFYLFRHSWLRWVFLAGSITMGIVVLAMHVHYSIDVLAAFFMTYGSYRIGHTVLRRMDPTYPG
jgi:hypothetical protein